MTKGKKTAGRKDGLVVSKPQVETYFPTVGIGASAGGIGALQAFFEEIPGKTGAAYVVIVHLDPTHASELAPILARKTNMPVQQVNVKAKLEPDNVYIIPPNRRLLITDHEIATAPFDEPRGMRSPIDQFFRSLADQHGDGFAVILTGGGSDGALGAKAIKEGGGIILVQDPREAEYPSMPRSAVEMGLVDAVLPVRDLAKQLVQMLESKAVIPGDGLDPDDEEIFFRILSYLRVQSAHDFLRYKRATIYRRLARRMQVRKADSLTEYFKELRENPEEVNCLFHDLLISVTTFFRDAEVFKQLASEAVSQIFNAEEEGPIRVWVPACASGEEAYSIAILFAEEAAKRDRRPEIQIFATDLDNNALTIAREGRYPLAIGVDVSEERLNKYFTKQGDFYRIRQEIRDMVLFASHSLLKDPPFSRLHLVSCRNLLIYLERDLQEQVLETFNYALRPDGYLLLGASETADKPVGLFRVIDREARIYQKEAAQQRLDLPRIAVPQRSGDAIPMHIVSASRSAATAHHGGLEFTAPPSILVDTQHGIVNMSESAGRYLQPSGGQLRNDVTELARPELRFDLRAGLRLAFERNQPSLSLGIPVRFNGSPHRVLIQIRPISGGKNPQQAVVFFIEGDSIPETEAGITPAERDNAAEEIIRRLKQELELSRSQLRSSREEFEGANEELRAANEELQSINEEFRSTAEELETSKEELQSVNEELETVNVELQSKLDNVSKANSDLQNLMAATDVGTLFLDSKLNIKLFTPFITDLFNIRAPDQSRSIEDFTHKLDYPNFVEDARTVLRTSKPSEGEVQGNGKVYLSRMRPYRTLDGRIDGVVCTFVDITERLQFLEALKSESRLKLLLGELSHRVKNTLAVVQSMSRQSFSKGVSREEGLEIFSNRLRALAEAHNLLVSSDWKGAPLRELAEGQIGPYVDGKEHSVILDGPEVVMPPHLATPLALILHELATNALKYGALGSPNGTLRLKWGFEADGAGRILRFNWHETGAAQKGAAQKEGDAKSGFGTWLIQNGMPEGKVELNFDDKGADCTIMLPERSLETE